MRRRILGLCLAALMLAGCSGWPEPSGSTPPETQGQTQPIQTEETTLPQETTLPEIPEETDPVEEIIQAMTLEEKVGQLFLVTPEALTFDGETVTILTQDLVEGMEQYPVGGIILFARNIQDPDQVTTLNARLQTASSFPLFLAVDEEGGTVARIGNNDAFDVTRYASTGVVGASGSRRNALDMGSTIGAYLRQYGFNLDFAPVADVNTNPDNPVIGNRAFSSQPEVAAELADAVAMGLRQQGIIPVFKHFPGHGDTAEDSHVSIAVSNKTLEEMMVCEFLPFLEAGIGDCIMVGHIAVPNLTGDMTPADLSYEVVTEILRNQLGFQGLVITDSLSMGAITESTPSGEAAVEAFLAGCDILLMPEDLPKAFEAVYHAVEDGTISMERLHESVSRIIQYKLDAGIWVAE